MQPFASLRIEKYRRRIIHPLRPGTKTRIGFCLNNPLIPLVSELVDAHRNTKQQATLKH
jgi:hypothetical protein